MELKVAKMADRSTKNFNLSEKQKRVRAEKGEKSFKKATIIKKILNLHKVKKAE